MRGSRPLYRANEIARRWVPCVRMTAFFGAAVSESQLEDDSFMTYVVADPCVNCRYTDCAMVCPVDAFHLDDDMLVINPETCIDCDACVPECPVEAIFAEDNVPEQWAQFTEMNAERALSGLPIFPSNAAKLVPMCH
jgi:ferredoxin